MSRFKQYLSKEIGIEFKACLYFYCILLFYSGYQILQGSLNANIIIMAEMIFITYIMGYLQVFLLHNFDEAEEFGIKEGIYSVLCSVIYSAIGYIFKWFDRSITAYAIFFLYLLFCYLCVFFVYKIKRDIDTMKLNQQLETFKGRKD